MAFFDNLPDNIRKSIEDAITAGVGFDYDQLGVIAAWYNAQDQNTKQQISNDFVKFQESTKQFWAEHDRQNDEFSKKFGLSQDQFNEAQRQYDANYQQRQYEFERQSGLSDAQFEEFKHQFDVGDERQKQQFAASLGLDYDKLNAQMTQFNTTEGRLRDEFAQTLNLDRDKLDEASRQFDVNNQTTRELAKNTLGFQYAELGVREAAGKESERTARANMLLNAPRGPADFFAYTSRLKGLQNSGELGDFLSNAMGEATGGMSRQELANTPVLTGTQYATDMARAARGERMSPESQGFLQRIGAAGPQAPSFATQRPTYTAFARQQPSDTAPVGQQPPDTANVWQGTAEVESPTWQGTAEVESPTWQGTAESPTWQGTAESPTWQGTAEVEPNIRPAEPTYEKGAVDVKKTQEAKVHKGEMIIPAVLAQALRNVLTTKTKVLPARSSAAQPIATARDELRPGGALPTGRTPPALPERRAPTPVAPFVATPYKPPVMPGLPGREPSEITVPGATPGAAAIRRAHGDEEARSPSKVSAPITKVSAPITKVSAPITKEPAGYHEVPIGHRAFDKVTGEEYWFTGGDAGDPRAWRNLRTGEREWDELHGPSTDYAPVESPDLAEATPGGSNESEPEGSNESEPEGSNESEYAEGTMFAPQTQQATIHEGEMRIPPAPAENVREQIGAYWQNPRPYQGGFIGQLGQLLNRRRTVAAPPTGYGSSIQRFNRLDPTARQMFFGALGERGGELPEDFMFNLKRAAPQYARSARARLG